MTENIISKAEAKNQGLKFYYTGKPCKHGHISRRWVRSTVCHTCDLARGAKNRLDPAYKIVQRRAAATWESSNKIKVAEQRRNRHLVNPIIRLYSDLKSRAKRKGLKFDLEKQDLVLPANCPALGTPIDYALGSKGYVRPNSPSVDRIHPDKGYTKGNVIVVSMLANAIKQNAMPEQIRKVANFYQTLLDKPL